jgi:hypothetical protein
MDGRGQGTVHGVADGDLEVLSEDVFETLRQRDVQVAGVFATQLGLQMRQHQEAGFAADAGQQGRGCRHGLVPQSGFQSQG